MAIMTPDFVSPSCQSDAEKNLFKRLKRELPDKYHVLHSLGIPKHTNKIWGEADFVVIGPKGVLCIEVKGGGVNYRNGRWWFTNRKGETNSKHESPMDQAKTCMISLRARLREHFGSRCPIFNCTYGYAAFFLDQSFDRESAEWDLNRISDVSVLRASGRSLDQIIESHFSYSSEEYRRLYKSKELFNLSPTLINDLRNFCRRDYEAVLPLGVEIDAAHQSLIRLTEEQIIAYDNLSTSRLLVKGGAGTGKTLLALHKARKHYSNGDRVLFLCYNKLLAKHIAGQVKREGINDRLQVSTFHKFMLDTVKEGGLMVETQKMRVDQQKIFYKEELPELFMRAFCEKSTTTPFDVLIVDEGQDLRVEQTYFEVLDWLIEGGLKEGRWAWFEDEQQSIFNRGAVSSENPIDKFNSGSIRLTKNCRNTSLIARFVSSTTKTMRGEVLQKEGPIVRHEYYESQSEQASLLKKSLNALLREDGLSEEDIVILSASSDAKGVVESPLVPRGFKFDKLEKRSVARKGSIGHSTAGLFKGLESRIVIVTDVNSLDQGEDLKRLYVALTRANTLLVVLMNRDLKELFEERWFAFEMQQSQGER